VGANAKASASEGTDGVLGAKFNPSKIEGIDVGLNFCSGIPLLGDGFRFMPSTKSRGNNSGELSLPLCVEVSSMQSARQICKLLLGVAFMGGSR